MNTCMKIILAKNPSEYEIGFSMFSKYIDSLDLNLDFQNYQHELKNIETIYRSPAGALVLVKDYSGYVGCAGIRKFTDDVCELKRTYVLPAKRGRGIGQLLLTACLDEARNLGYKQIYLDTHTKMKAAISLYLKNGFKYIPAYYDNPIQETRYLAIEL